MRGERELRLLITGGSGFIGTNLVEFYAKRGTILLNLDWNPPMNPAHSAYWRLCDIMDARGVEQVLTEFAPTHIVHLAARTDTDELVDVETYRQNHEGTPTLNAAIKDKVFPNAGKVRDQRFHGGVRRIFSYRPNGFGPDNRTSVFQVITVYRGNYPMLHFHQPDGFSHPKRLLQINCRGPACCYSAKTATPGTDISQNHKRCRSCPPAFAHVGAIPAFADGMKLMIAHQRPDLPVFFSYGKFNPEPFGLCRSPDSIFFLHTTAKVGKKDLMVSEFTDWGVGVKTKRSKTSERSILQPRKIAGTGAWGLVLKQRR